MPHFWIFEDVAGCVGVVFAATQDAFVKVPLPKRIVRLPEHRSDLFGRRGLVGANDRGKRPKNWFTEKLGAVNFL